MAARSTVGLDIGTGGVRAAELAPGSADLRRFGQVALPAGAVVDGEVVDAAAVTTALRELWRSTRFSTRRVSIGVSHQRVIVRRIDLPDMAPDDLRQALPFQVQDVLPMPVDEALLDFLPLERVPGPGGSVQLRGLLVAAWRDSVRAVLDAVEAAGLQVQSVDLSPLALLRSVGARGAGPLPDTTTEALVDVGASVTDIVIHTAGSPHFVRVLLRGGAQITEALAERAGIPTSDAEQLKRDLGLGESDTVQTVVGHAVDAAVRTFVEEVRNTVDYHVTSDPGRPVGRIVLVGGGAQLGGLAERLTAATGLPVVRGSVEPRIARGDGTRAARAAEDLAAAPVSVGLALGA